MASKCFNLFKLNRNLVASKRFEGTQSGPVLKEKYKQFQRDDGIPVFQKGGFSDRILLVGTLLLIGYGLLNGFSAILPMAFPKKK